MPEKHAFKVAKTTSEKNFLNWAKWSHLQKSSKYLSTQFSQLPFAQIQKFWCLSDREFPELFKTPHTFNSRVNVKGDKSNQNV